MGLPKYCWGGAPPSKCEVFIPVIISLLVGYKEICLILRVALPLVLILVGEMEGSEGVKLDELGEGEMEGVDEEYERVFRVGELVEFWVGPVARAYLTDSGAPAL